MHFIFDLFKNLASTCCLNLFEDNFLILVFCQISLNISVRISIPIRNMTMQIFILNLVN